MAADRLPGPFNEGIRRCLDPARVITDPDILVTYSVDETSDLAGMPDMVVRPLSAVEISAVLVLCTAHGVPAVARGAGTGVTGGAVPVCGGIVISLELMNKILEIDRENMIAVVEPCAITGDIQRAVLGEGLLYPPDPASLDQCSIGGNVAENAGGPRAVKYGTTRDYILGLEFVLPDGAIIQTGGKLVKNVTGYNITGILIGSEGTLAVITKIFLRLIPAPPVVKDLLIPFATLDAAIDTVYAILRARIVPAAIEFMEDEALKLVAKFLGSGMPFPLAGAHLLIQLDGDSDEALYAQMEKISALPGVDPDSIIVAESPSQKQKLWKARRSIREAITAESPVFLAEDCVVPRARIPRFLKDLKALFESRGLRSVMFGHAGDGNVHIDVLRDGRDYEEWKRLLPELKKEIYTRAIALEGTITGEHGVGFTRKEYLGLALSKEEIALMARIKKAFDPGMILNPGKIFI